VLFQFWHAVLDYVPYRLESDTEVVQDVVAVVAWSAAACGLTPTALRWQRCLRPRGGTACESILNMG
jgi:hypothetical protein